MSTISLNGTVIGLVPGEKWPIKIRPVIDGELPASTAVVEIAFLNQPHTLLGAEAISPLSPSNGATYSLTWNASLSFTGGLTGGWEGEVSAADTSKLLSDTADKNSRIIPDTVLYLYTSVDGQTIRDSKRIPLLRGIGSISLVNNGGGNQTLSSVDFDLSSSVSLIGRLI